METTGVNDPVYVKLRHLELGECVHQTKELIPGQVFADFDETGNLIGLEILGPVVSVTWNTRM